MNVLIVGSGMYVTGRNNGNEGTVLASLIQASKEIHIENVIIVAKKKSNQHVVSEASKNINHKLNTHISVRYISLLDTPLNEVCKSYFFHCAIVSTPDHYHFEHIVTLFKNKIHVLCVKPLVSTVEENKQLIELQKQYNVLGVVEFHKRYDEANLYTKNILQENKLGDLLYYDVNYSQRISIPTATFKEWVMHTNVFQYLGVHYVDLFYFMTGFKPLKLIAYGTQGILKGSNINTYDSVHSSIIWQNENNKQCMSTFNINWIDPNCSSAMSDQKYKIVGTKGRIENNHKNRGIEVVSSEENIQHPNPYFSNFLLNENGEYVFSGYGHKSIKQFLLDVQSILNNEEKIDTFESKRPTFQQALIASSVIEAVNKSIENNSNWENIKHES